MSRQNFCIKMYWTPVKMLLLANVHCEAVDWLTQVVCLDWNDPPSLGHDLETLVYGKLQVSSHGTKQHSHQIQWHFNWKIKAETETVSLLLYTVASGTHFISLLVMQNHSIYSKICQLNFPINTLRPAQNGCIFVNKNFKSIILPVKLYVLIYISIKFVPDS